MSCYTLAWLFLILCKWGEEEEALACVCFHSDSKKALNFKPFNFKQQVWWHFYFISSLKKKNIYKSHKPKQGNKIIHSLGFLWFKNTPLMTLFCVCKPGVTDKWCPAACEQQHLWDGCSQWVHFILHPTLFFCLFFSCCFLVARGPTHALKTCKRSTKSQKLNPWLVAVDPCAVQSRWSSKTKTSRHFIDAKLGVKLMRIDGFTWIYDHISGRWGEKPLMRLTEVLTCTNVAHTCAAVGRGDGEP